MQELLTAPGQCQTPLRSMTSRAALRAAGAALTRSLGFVVVLLKVLSTVQDRSPTAFWLCCLCEGSGEAPHTRFGSWGSTRTPSPLGVLPDKPTSVPLQPQPRGALSCSPQLCLPGQGRMLPLAGPSAAFPARELQHSSGWKSWFAPLVPAQIFCKNRFSCCRSW